MSLGFQRLNVKKTPPNDRIAFIKPLPGSDDEVAQDFLERIAAQCYPIMKRNYLSVRSLEEYEPNREFVGRNFNAGEVIQLVLKSQSGRWLPFNYVQMVMMHELAHCKQMNHSKAFWAVRNQYARDMEGLWRESYTGEGLWGRGRELSTGRFRRATIQAGDVLPEHICGGTYRTNRGSRKRKAKDTLTWKERKEKRILKKFGANGVALGSDEDTKVKLEQGKKAKGKPRVAQSQRGRELRAAAALARFEEGRKVKEAEESEESEEVEIIKIESDKSEDEGGLTSVPDALDIDGQRLVDKDGVGLVKVCGDEDENGHEASEEMRELLRSFGDSPSGDKSRSVPPAVKGEPGVVKKEPRSQPTIAEMFREARERRGTKDSTGDRGRGEK